MSFLIKRLMRWQGVLWYELLPRLCSDEDQALDAVAGGAIGFCPKNFLWTDSTFVANTAVCQRQSNSNPDYSRFPRRPVFTSEPLA